MKTLIDLGSKVYTIYPTYAIKLGLYSDKVDVSVQKINKFYLDYFKMIIADCLVENNLGRF